jgi:type IV secretion system protein TrbG
MKKVFVVLFMSMASSAWAQDPSPSPGPSKFSPELLGGSNPTLTDQERAGVDVTEAWKAKSLATMVGQPGSTSSAVFRFGQSLPSVVCAVLQITDVELQAGETITQINLGDTTRWSIETAKSGSRTDEIEHLVIKPRDIGLSTSLVVATDRRTYHLLLRSDESGFMYYVRFEYGDSPTPAALAVTAKAKTDPADPALGDPPPHKESKGEGKQAVHRVSHKEEVVTDMPDDADESYVVKGKAEWAPVGVYSKDGKTYLEMPTSMRHKEAPVLFEETKSGWFHHSKDLVNFRVKGKWYVVDKVLDHAVLVTGVGSGQKKVTITHVDLPAKVEGSANVQ